MPIVKRLSEPIDCWACRGDSTHWGSQSDISHDGSTLSWVHLLSLTTFDGISESTAMQKSELSTPGRVQRTWSVDDLCCLQPFDEESATYWIRPNILSWTKIRSGEYPEDLSGTVSYLIRAGPALGDDHAGGVYWPVFSIVPFSSRWWFKVPLINLLSNLIHH